MVSVQYRVCVPALSRTADSKFSPNQTICGLKSPLQFGFLQCGKDETGILDSVMFASSSSRLPKAYNNIQVLWIR